MPLQTPFPVSGTITNINGNTIQGAKVEIHNLVNSDSASTTTDSSGVYMVDLRNKGVSFVDGDIILIRAWIEGTFKFREIRVTLRVAEGKIEQDLTLKVENPKYPEKIDKEHIDEQEHHLTASSKKVILFGEDGDSIIVNDNFDLANNPQHEWEITNNDGQPESETVTLADGRVYKRTFTYSTGSFGRVMTKRSSWVKQ